jgi:hypothetical protein
MKTLIATVLTVSLTGCSFIAVTPVPRIVPPHQHVDCTSSMNAPVADAIVTTVTAAVALALLAAAVSPCEGWGCIGKDSAGVGAIIFGIPAVTFGASTAYGFHETAVCEQINGDAEAAPVTLR